MRFPAMFTTSVVPGIREFFVSVAFFIDWDLIS